MIFPQTSDFDFVYAKLKPELIRHASKFLPTPEDAEDLVADVFLKLLEKKVMARNIKAIRPFLYLCIRNACINRSIKNKRLQFVELDVLKHSAKEECAISESEENRINIVYNYALALPLKCRETVFLNMFYQLSLKEIAKIMNVSIHTARNQKVRGLDIVKKQYEWLMKFEDDPMTKWSPVVFQKNTFLTIANGL